MSVREALEAWLEIHDEYSPGLIEGLYVVGSAALDDWQPNSDIDIVAVCPIVPDDEQVAALRTAHEATVEAVGDVDIDGPRLTWRDVAGEPIDLIRPWTLGGEFHHNNECFELNPVMWHELAYQSQSMRGPERTDLTVAVESDSLSSFVRANTDGYWRSVAGAVGQALDDPDRTEFPAEMTSWCVLGLARMLYTARTGSIASKTVAGRWLAAEHPEFESLVAHAAAVRRHGSSGPDDREMALATGRYMQTLIDIVVTDNGG